MRGSINWLYVLGLVVLVVLVVAVLLLTGVVPWPWGASDSDLPPLADFVSAVHAHGVPYEVASRYPKSTVDTLLDWLAKDAYQPYWANIVLTIGMIGPTNSGQIDRLTEFVRAPSPAPLSAAAYQAKQSAIIALGYAAHAMAGDDQALDYLLGSSEPTQWGVDRTSWQTPFSESKAVIQRHFARLGVISLGLSGRGRARTRLIDLRDNAGVDPVDASFRVDNAGIIAAAIATHTTVSASGLGSYHKKKFRLRTK